MTDSRNPYQDDWSLVKGAYMARNPETGRTYVMPSEANYIAWLVVRWKETGQASFLDVAMQYCDDKDLPILKELRKFFAELARKRSPYEESKAYKEAMKDKAFTGMVQLIYQDATLSEAAGKAAAWMHDNNVPTMASTLEKQYTEKYRSGKKPLEQILIEGWKHESDSGLDDALSRQRNILRGPTADELGNRRD